MIPGKVETMSASLQNWLRRALWGCLIFAVLAVVLDAAISATPWSTRDSRGTEMGFNDRFSKEHYQIAFEHLRSWQLLNPCYIYDWIEWGMIVAGIRLLAPGRVTSGIHVRRFFLAQSGVFFLGWLGWVFLFWPKLILQLVRLELDREDFVDIPFTWVMAQPPWVLMSFVVFAILYSQNRHPNVPGVARTIAPAEPQR